MKLNRMEKKEQKPRITYYSSEINRRLKVLEENGRKLLNTIDSNYSYGGLQVVLDEGLSLLPINNFGNVLVLGIGAGSVVDSLRNKYGFEGKIIGVELDPVVIDIAKSKFGLLDFENIEVIQEDAAVYVKNSEVLFDFIVVDLFINIEVPTVFYQQEFWNDVERLVSDNGFVLFNAGIDWELDSMYEFLDRVPESFVYQKILNVNGCNTLIILHKVF